MIISRGRVGCCLQPGQRGDAWLYHGGVRCEAEYGRWKENRFMEGQDTLLLQYLNLRVEKNKKIFDMTHLNVSYECNISGKI